MSDIETRVKKIIAEQLGVEESQVTNEKAFQTKTQKKLPPCKTLSITHWHIKKPNFKGFA